MDQSTAAQFVAFVGTRRVGLGPLPEVALAVRDVIDRGEQHPVLIFDDATGHVVDVDLRGTREEIVSRLEAAREIGGADESPNGSRDASPDASPYRDIPVARGRGRPKLGVVAREVTLLPRHWDWLASQPGGASAAVRRLVDAARQMNAGADRTRQARETAYRFMSAMAGNAADFEEATRALFAGDMARFTEMTERWPSDVRDHARRLAARSFT